MYVSVPSHSAGTLPAEYPKINPVGGELVASPDKCTQATCSCVCCESFIGSGKVMERLDIGNTKLWDMITKGELPDGVPITPGGKKRWLKSEIHDFIMRRVAAARGAPCERSPK